MLGSLALFRWITLSSVGFCLTKVLSFAMVNMFEDDFARERAATVLQSFDFIWVGMLLVVCRARKEWPPYFSLSINEVPGLQEDANGERRAAMPPALTSFITTSFLFDEDFTDVEKRRCDSFGSFADLGEEDAIMIVGPTKYTLEAEYEPIGITQEISAFEEIVEDAPDKSTGQRDDLK